jgi:hypothetical protein
LNNPLKYIDPSGHAGEGLQAPKQEGQLGYTSAGGWVVCENGKWVSIETDTVNAMVSDYGNSNSNNWTEYYQANKPDTSYPLPNTWGGNMVTIDNKNFIWQTYPIFNPLNKQNSNEIRLALSEEPDLMKDAIFFADTIALTGDAVSYIPGLNAVGYGTSCIAGTVSYALTVYEYKNGRISKDDMFKSHISWAGGFIPGVWGGGFTGWQTYLDGKSAY